MDEEHIDIAGTLQECIENSEIDAGLSTLSRRELTPVDQESENGVLSNITISRIGFSTEDSSKCKSNYLETSNEGNFQNPDTVSLNMSTRDSGPKQQAPDSENQFQCMTEQASKIDSRQISSKGELISTGSGLLEPNLQNNSPLEVNRLFQTECSYQSENVPADSGLICETAVAPEISYSSNMEKTEHDLESELQPSIKRFKTDLASNNQANNNPEGCEIIEDESEMVTTQLDESEMVTTQLDESEMVTTQLDDSEEIQSSSTVLESVYQFNGPPKQLTGAWQCYTSSDNTNYLRGCKWAPDGTCILTNSNDNIIRLFNLPEQLYVDGGENQNIAEMSPVLKMKEADTIYDYCWYPTMSSADPVTACLAVTSRDTPVHLYDAFTGDLRCSYRAYNHVDEIAAAHSVTFDPCGEKLYCGFSKIIRVFDVSRPGRQCVNRPTFAKQGQRGIISCIAHSPRDHGLYAAGSYARSIALYQEPKGEMICMFEGQQGGVTQITFSPDGTKLYSGGRKDNEILCWDLRNPGHIVYSLIRTVCTNQRIYFDITSDGRYIVSGSHDGNVIVWDTSQPPITTSTHADPVLQAMMAFEAHTDTVNGVSLHPSLPIIATASGQRHFQCDDDDDDNVEQKQSETVDNSMRLWWTTTTS